MTKAELEKKVIDLQRTVNYLRAQLTERDTGYKLVG